MINEVEVKPRKKYQDGGVERDNRLPRVPTITKEQQAEIDEQQAKMARHMSLTADPNTKAFARAHAIITEMDAIPREEWNERQLARYVEALTVVGKFNEAYELTGNEDYRLIWESIWKDDTEKCDCPDTTEVTLKANMPVSTTYSRHFVRKKVYSLKHEGWVHLQTCNKCLHMNSIPDAPPVIIAK